MKNWLLHHNREAYCFVDLLICLQPLCPFLDVWLYQNKYLMKSFCYNWLLANRPHCNRSNHIINIWLGTQFTQPSVPLGIQNPNLTKNHGKPVLLIKKKYSISKIIYLLAWWSLHQQSARNNLLKIAIWPSVSNIS